MIQSEAPTLAIFAKEPQAGRAKTRLIPAIGAEAAARLSAAFLDDLIGRLSREILAPTRMLLCFDPPTAEIFFRKKVEDAGAAGRIGLHCQCSGDLGRRLAAVRATVAGPLGYMGTDAPDLPLLELRKALQHAVEDRAYMLNTADGGYALLALPAGAPPEVFDAIAWSTAQTAQQQRERIRAAGIEVVTSNTIWWDVDEPADLLPLRRRLEGDSHVAPRTLAELRSLGTLPGESPR